MPNGFLATGGVSQVAGLGFRGIGDTVDMNPLAVSAQVGNGNWGFFRLSILLKGTCFFHLLFFLF
jgi:hypothetical protein